MNTAQPTRMSSGYISRDAEAFAREGNLVPKPTGHEHKKLTPGYPAFVGRASLNFRPSFERISDLQIPRGKNGFRRAANFNRAAQTPAPGRRSWRGPRPKPLSALLRAVFHGRG